MKNLLKKLVFKSSAPICNMTYYSDGKDVFINNFMSDKTTQQIHIYNSNIPAGVYLFDTLLPSDEAPADEYPIFGNPINNDEHLYFCLKTEIRSFTDEIKEFSKYLDKTEFRPAFMGIYYDAINQIICSTDAKALRIKKHDDLVCSFLVPREIDLTKLNLLCNHFKSFVFEIYKTDYKDENKVDYLIFKNSFFSYQIQYQVCKYPAVLTVVPERFYYDIKLNNTIINSFKEHAETIYKLDKKVVFSLVFDYQNKECFIMNNDAFKSQGLPYKSKVFSFDINYLNDPDGVNHKFTDFSLLMPIMVDNGFCGLGLNFKRFLKYGITNFYTSDKCGKKAIIFGKERIPFFPAVAESLPLRKVEFKEQLSLF